MRPKLKVIDDPLINQILDEARRILSQIGLEVRGSQLRNRLLEHGLKQDPRSGRVLFPPEVVDKAIADTPKSFTLYNRNGQPHAQLGGDNVYFVPASSGLRVLDYESQQVRPAKTADFVRYVWLADGLEHIAYLATAFSTDDIEAEVSDAWRLYLLLTHSLKPVVSGAFTEHGVPRMAHMMQLFRHDKADLIARPMAIFTITATGFFRYSEDSCQNLLDCVEWGIPIEIVPVTLMGLIAPVTLVGATIFHVADVLGGLTMAQIINPGTPVLFGGAPATFHMKKASSPMAAIEALHLDVAYAEVANYLGLPTQGYMGLSDAKLLDAQAGAETFSSALLAALVGLNSVSGPGLLDYLLVYSPEKLVFDNEVCGQVLHFVRQLKPLEDLSAVELAQHLLEEQHLLTDPHTLKYWPDELYLPSPIIDRFTREDWQKAGRHSLLERANQEVQQRMAAYSPIETDPRAEAEMRRLIKSGLDEAGASLPEIPPHRAKPVSATGNQRRRNRRRNRRRQ